MPNFDERALKLHKELQGKWGMRSKMPLENSDDLSIAYTPGVGAVSERIAEFSDEAHILTMKGNSVAIISDGSAVLGLGNLGPLAALPVMEGKAILFNRFAGVDGIPIVVDSQDPQKIIEFVKMIAPTFGGINLEDIKAPECFIVEDALQDIGIPVFHDDQHGTAVVLLGALINAAKVIGRPLSDLKVVINGAGAAGTAIAKLLMCIGVDKGDWSPVREVIICDSKGIISKERDDLNDFKRRFLEYTNPRNISGSVFEALKGADVFIGVSKGNLLQKEDIQTMNTDPIIFAMANPIPEIMPEVAYEGGAAEGPLPQTRFVLQKALRQGIKIIVVVNKIDRKDARPQEVLNEIYDLFIDLDVSEDQLEFPVLYAIGRDGIAQKSLDERGEDLRPLFEQIIETIPGPSYDDTEPFQMLVCNIGYSEYTGRLAIGKVFNGRVQKNDQLICIGADETHNLKVSKLQTYDGLKFQDVDSVDAGEIIILSGVSEVKIGDTICQKENPKALERVEVDEPTVSMRFMANSSPLSGTEGKLVQSTRILERLQKETLYNVALELEETESSECFIVKGRGEFQMAVLIETMRREGFELMVGRPQIILKEKDGETLEPIEHVVIDCDDEFTGIVTEKLSKRKGRMTNMSPYGSGRTRVEFSIPSRGLIGFRNEFLTDTKGTGIMNAYVEGYEAFRGEIPSRHSGSLICDRAGKAVAYAIFNLEDRGKMFIKPGDPLYEGMIVGEHTRDSDLLINPTKTKKLTNMRAAGKDDAVTLTPIQNMSLERAIEFIKDDEFVEVTPKSIRLRKEILDFNERKIAEKKKNLG